MSTADDSSHHTDGGTTLKDSVDMDDLSDDEFDADGPSVPKSFVNVINTMCFKLHQFTTLDLLQHGLRFVTILLFTSLVLPYNMFHILLFILIVVLALVYVVGKNAFKADKADARVIRNRLAEFRAKFGNLRKSRGARPVPRSKIVN